MGWVQGGRGGTSWGGLGPSGHNGSFFLGAVVEDLVFGVDGKNDS